MRRDALVHGAQGGQFQLLATDGRARRDVRHRLRAGYDERSLMGAGQEIAGEDLRAGVRLLRRNDDKTRQVAIQRAQAVADPRADARPREVERARMHAERRVVMIRVRGVHRTDQRDVVHALGHVWKQRTDLRAAFAVRRKIPLRAFQKNALVTGPVLDLRMVQFHLLAVIANERRLGVEAVHVRHAAGHEQEDHAFRLRRKLRCARRQRIGIVGQQLLHDPRKQQRPGDGGLQEAAARESVVGSHGSIPLMIQSRQRNSLPANSTRT